MKKNILITLLTLSSVMPLFSMQNENYYPKNNQRNNNKQIKALQTRTQNQIHHKTPQNTKKLSKTKVYAPVVIVKQEEALTQINLEKEKIIKKNYHLKQIQLKNREVIIQDVSNYGLQLLARRGTYHGANLKHWENHLADFCNENYLVNNYYSFYDFSNPLIKQPLEMKRSLHI